MDLPLHASRFAHSDEHLFSFLLHNTHTQKKHDKISMECRRRGRRGSTWYTPSVPFCWTLIYLALSTYFQISQFLLILSIIYGCQVKTSVQFMLSRSVLFQRILLINWVGLVAMKWKSSSDESSALCSSVNFFIFKTQQKILFCAGVIDCTSWYWQLI